MSTQQKKLLSANDLGDATNATSPLFAFFYLNYVKAFLSFRSNMV